MEEITNYINDQQLSEYLNVEENENPKPVSSSKKSSFQSLIREVVLCHMREIEDTKGSCRKGAEVLVKRYKAVKEEKLKLKSKVEYWSDECKKLQYENSKLLSFLKNGLCTKCDNHMKMVCGNNEFSRQPGHSPEATASKGNKSSRLDRSADEGGVSLIEGVHPSEDRSMSSDSYGTDDTSPKNASKNRKLKLNRRSSRCRYAATSVKLRKSPTTTLQKESPPSKRESRRESRGSSGAQSLSGNGASSPITKKSEVAQNKNTRSSTGKNDVDLEASLANSKSLAFDKASSDDDIVMASPKLKRLKHSEPASLKSPKLSKLKLTKEADRVLKRKGRIMKYRSKSNQSLKSPSLFDEGHDLIIEDEVIANSPIKPQSRRSVKDYTAREVRENRACHSISVQSTPSPSVLSGNIPKFNISEKKIGESSPNLKARRSRQTEDIIEIDADVGAENAGSPSSSKHKKLVQTRITKEMFMPTKTYLPNIDEFNSGVLTPSKCDKETKDLQEAIKRSLEENAKKNLHSKRTESGYGCHQQSESKSENSCLESISAFTVPPLTSTPFERDLEHSDTFKKPQIPKKVPTTPKGKQVTSSPRRSPRLNKFSKTCNEPDVFESVESLPDLDVPPHNSARIRHSKSRRTLEMDRIPLKEVSISVLSKANGSIDPHAHLSQYETVPDDYADDVLPTLRPSRRSRDKTPKSPQEETPYSLDSDSLDMTCQSVVFGPPKVQGTKLSNPRDENDVKAAHGSPEKVIYVPETMDVDLDSDYEDAVNNLGGFAVATPGGNTKDAETPKGPGIPEDSFDFVQKDEGPNYAYAEVVRKRSEREQLKGYTCPECEAYFNADGAAGDNLKFCRHKARYVPPSTPEHFWDLTLPDTQVAQERGYMNITQGKASKFRRKRKLNKLFKSKDESGSEEYEDDI